MAIHPQFPLSPYEIVLPEYRWIPSNESLKETPHERLLPPLVHALRKKEFTWKGKRYHTRTKDELEIGAKEKTKFAAAAKNKKKIS